MTIADQSTQSSSAVRLLPCTSAEFWGKDSYPIDAVVDDEASASPQRAAIGQVRDSHTDYLRAFTVSREDC